MSAENILLLRNTAHLSFRPKSTTRGSGREPESIFLPFPPPLAGPRLAVVSPLPLLTLIPLVIPLARLPR